MHIMDQLHAPKLPKKLLPASCYYSSAAFACIDSVAFASSCSIIPAHYTSSPDHPPHMNHHHHHNHKPAFVAKDSASRAILRDCQQRSKQVQVKQQHQQPPIYKHHSAQKPSPKISSIPNSQLALNYQPPSSCSVCGKALQMGCPTRGITYAELKQATDNFSRSNFLSEGESAFVYRGVLGDSKQVAVKLCGQKTAKFHSELQILGSVQHPNIVSLVGYCDEASKALLVYDLICNGTLDWHLSVRNPNVVPWPARRVIAVQIARGLQFLHECGLGCLVHGDIRANNILLTHDYTPVIAGFGHARWVPGLKDEDELKASVPGYFGSESIETGEGLTEKSDVYAFGILLLELISGRPVFESSLVDWARPLLLEDFEAVLQQILDPRLGTHYKHYELVCMVNATSMCLRKDPATRPRMRQILSNLEDVRERMKITPLTPDFVKKASTPTNFQPQIKTLLPETENLCSNKKKSDKKKSALTVTWQLPESPSLLIRPNPTASSSKPQRPRRKLLSYSELL